MHSEIAELKERIRALEAELAKCENLQRELSEDRSFREAVIERAAEGVCVCQDVPDFPHVRFTVWNRRMTEITGYEVDEINRRGWYQTVYPDPKVQSAARERMAEMREGIDLYGERWEITRADGELRVLSISSSILTTADNVAHVLGLMQDVTAEDLYRRQLEGEVTKLRGLLPVCAWCKKIRDEHDRWHDVDVYIADHFETDVTHGICPDCRTRQRPPE